MEAAFIFFVFDDPSRWNDKSEKCKESIHQKLTCKIGHENDGRDQLYFCSYGQSKGEDINCHITVYFSAVTQRSICLLSGSFFYLLSVNKPPCLFNATTKTHFWWYMWRNIECFFETWNLNTKNKSAFENVQQEILQENKCPGINADKAKLKIKTIRSMNSAGLLNHKKWCIYRWKLCSDFLTNHFIPASYLYLTTLGKQT